MPRSKRAGAEPPFQIADADRDLGPTPLGDHPIALRLTNPASRPRDILGLGANAVCAWGACFDPFFPDKIAVAPGGTAEVTGILKVHKAGPFHVVIPMYLESNGARQIDLNVRGDRRRTRHTLNSSRALSRNTSS